MPFLPSMPRTPVPFRRASTAAALALAFIGTVIIGTVIAFAPNASAQCLSGAQLSISIAAPDVIISSIGVAAPHELQQTTDLVGGAWSPLALYPSGTFDATDPAPPEASRAYRVVCDDGSPLLSQNAVGYVRRSVTTGALQLLGVPLLGAAGLDASLDELVGAQAGIGSAVYKWDRVTNGYTPAIRTGAGWLPNLILQPGDVFWIDPAADGGGESTYDVSLAGEVPGDASGHSSIVLGDIAQDFVANPYPVAIEWTGSDLAGAVPGGSAVFWWDAQNQVFSSMTKDPTTGWPSPLPLEPGDGVFVLSTNGGGDWHVTKPYAWP